MRDMNYGRRRAGAGFTMIEIAICIAIVAFAMVAILGVLPAGLQVQKSNREDTLVSMDGAFFIEAIRSGSRGLVDLPNSVDWIQLTNRGLSLGLVTNFSGGNQLVGGGQIIGLLSTPRYFVAANGRCVTNLAGPVRAKIHALSGSAIERSPSLKDFSFSYVLESEIVPAFAVPPAYTNFTGTDVAGNTNILAARSNLWAQANRLAGDCYELRITMRWPVRPDNTVGGEKQTFRALLTGGMVTNTDVLRVDGQNLQWSYYFFQPSMYGH
jgi:type II secretory pathway pseudopilin PulG